MDNVYKPKNSTPARRTSSILGFFRE